MKIFSIIIFILSSISIILLGEFYKIPTLILLFLCIKQGNKEKFWYNPFYLLCITIISFLLCFPQLAPLLIYELSPLTYLLINFCLYSLFISFILVKKINLQSISSSHNENYIIIFTIGIIPTLIAYYLYGSVFDKIGEDILDTKNKMSLPIIGQLTFFLQASLLLAIKRNSIKLIVITLIVCSIASLLTLTKTSIIITIVFFIIGLSRFKPNLFEFKFYRSIRYTSIIWLPAIVFFLFMYNNTIRHEATSTSNLNYIEKGTTKQVIATSDFEENLYLNYLYFCSPWGNLSYNIDYNNSVGNGANTFSQFGKKMGIDIQPVAKMNPTFLNTHTFITDYYLDFGIFGAIIASFILGIIIYICYAKFGCSNDPMLLSFYSLVSYATIMLFFSNHFNYGYLLNYYISFGLYYILSKKIKFL